MTRRRNNQSFPLDLMERQLWDQMAVEQQLANHHYKEAATHHKEMLQTSQRFWHHVEDRTEKPKDSKLVSDGQKIRVVPQKGKEDLAAALEEKTLSIKKLQLEVALLEKKLQEASR